LLGCVKVLQRFIALDVQGDISCDLGLVVQGPLHYD